MKSRNRNRSRSRSRRRTTANTAKKYGIKGGNTFQSRKRKKPYSHMTNGEIAQEEFNRTSAGILALMKSNKESLILQITGKIRIKMRKHDSILITNTMIRNALINVEIAELKMISNQLERQMNYSLTTNDVLHIITYSNIDP